MGRDRKSLINRSAVCALGLSVPIGLAIPIAYLHESPPEPLPPLPIMAELKAKLELTYIDPEFKTFYYQTERYTLSEPSSSDVADRLKEKLRAPEWRFNDYRQTFVKRNFDSVTVTSEKKGTVIIVISTGYSPIRLWNAYMKRCGY